MRFEEENREERQPETLPLRVVSLTPPVETTSLSTSLDAKPFLVSPLQIGVWISYLNRLENGFLHLTAIVPALMMVGIVFALLMNPTALIVFLGLEIISGGMVAGLLVPRAINKNKSRAALLETLTHCEKDHLETVCYIQTAHDKTVRTAAGARLLDLLSEFESGEGFTLGRYSRISLHRILKSREPQEIRLALNAMEYIGGEQDIALVKALSEGKYLADFSNDVRQKAKSILSVLRERAANQKLGTTLLRASSCTESGDTLLRPTTYAIREDESETLLRVGEAPTNE